MGKIKDWLLGTKYTIKKSVTSGVYSVEDEKGNTVNDYLESVEWTKNKLSFVPENASVADSGVGRGAKLTLTDEGELHKTNNYKGVIILALVAAGITGVVLLWNGFAGRNTEIEKLKNKLSQCDSEKESLQNDLDAANNAKAKAENDAKNKDSRNKTLENDNQLLQDSIEFWKAQADSLQHRADSLQKGWYGCRGLDEDGKPRKQSKPKEEEKPKVNVTIEEIGFDCWSTMRSGVYHEVKPRNQ
ncbi:MAG: hypothetical protein IJR92_00550 [Alphaproteobacteria bacterium]|nr:hypothetical protein [Alphaproteobacteria bacterium]